MNLAKKQTKSSIWTILNLPIVVTTVVLKKSDCPKLQFGGLETFLAADTPLLLALTTSDIRFSKSSSANSINHFFFER